MKNKGLPKNSKKRVKALPYILLIPNMLLLFAFTFYPFLRSIYLSLCVTDPLGNVGAFVGLANYERIMTGASFAKSMKATLLLAVMIGVGTFVVSMFFASLCVDVVRGSKLYQTMYAMPIAMATVPVCSIALYFFGVDGFINNLIGSRIGWLSTESTVLWCVAAIQIWSSVGVSFIYLLVGFRNVPESLVESAKLDGAGFLTRFFRIYMPIASPQIFFVVFLNIISSFKAFGPIKVLTEGGPNESTNILIYAIYSNAFKRGRFETACVYATILCMVIFLITRVQLIFEKRMVHYQ